jgi:hypothetical protein
MRAPRWVSASRMACAVALQAVVERERCGMPDNAERSLTSGSPHDGNRLRIRCSAQDQSEWQIEWQTALACACPGLVSAGLCSCSS